MEIAFEPYKKVTIRNYMYHDTVESFANALTLTIPRELGAGGRYGPLLWTNGILFRHMPFFATDTMTKEYVQGHFPIDNIEFAHMPEFREEIHFRQYTLTVMDVSSNYVLGEIGRWVAQNLLNKKKKKDKSR